MGEIASSGQGNSQGARNTQHILQLGPKYLQS